MSKTISSVDAHPPRLWTRYTEKGRRRMLARFSPHCTLTNWPGRIFSPMSGATMVNEW
jgi:hypothetical protein